MLSMARVADELSVVFPGVQSCKLVLRLPDQGLADLDSTNLFLTSFQYCMFLQCLRNFKDKEINIFYLVCDAYTLSVIKHYIHILFAFGLISKYFNKSGSE